MKCVELFTGCGGLATGLSRAGFHHAILVEWNDDACLTLAHNKARGVRHVENWPIVHADVRSLEWTELVATSVEVVAGGPPCQPFSIGGKHAGPGDERDMWPEAIRAVRDLGPGAFLFENVRGLLRPGFSDYLGWIRLHLGAPQLVRRLGEALDQHLARLEAAQGEALYEVQVRPVNAADYGAPQKRNRVIVAGVRKDLGVGLRLPEPTHSRERLLWDQWITGEYWKHHGIRKPKEGPGSLADRRAVERLRGRVTPPEGKPWVTCRDAFEGLGEPGTNPNVSNHVFQDGAKVYPGHTGSPIDEPAKALKAGDHGVPGGENMVVLPTGKVRYFTVREAARLQGLPDEFEFSRSWTESMRQLGNAVPVQLAEAMAVGVREALGVDERVLVQT